MKRHGIGARAVGEKNYFLSDKSHMAGQAWVHVTNNNEHLATPNYGEQERVLTATVRISGEVS